MGKPIEIPFIGGAYAGRSKNVNAQVCQNLYPVLDQEGGKRVLYLQGRPGLKKWLDLEDFNEVRAMLVHGVFLIAVCGTSVYKIDKEKTKTLLGSINTSTGAVYLVDGRTYIMITDGQDGWYIDLDDYSLTQITDPDFPTPSSSTFQDGFYLAVKAGTDEFYISATIDPSSWSASAYATAESNSDEIVRNLSDHKELWLFGTKTTEAWYTVQETVPFSLIPGTIMEVGLGAAASVAQGDNSLFWLDNNRQARRAEGYTPRIISTRQVEYQWGSYDTVADARGWSYSQEGHTFYELVFPQAEKAWAYDVSTQMWHTRATGAHDGRHRANCYAKFDDKHMVGDFKNGIIYEYDYDTYDDNGDTMRAIRRGQAVAADRSLVFHNSLEIEFEGEVGLATGQGSDPQAMLRYSDDGAKTWSNEDWRSMGKIGENDKRVTWNRLGRSRDRIYEVVIADPVKRVILSAHLKSRMGIS